MKRLLAPALALLAILPSMAEPRPPCPSYPLGCFNFDFERLGKTEAEQIRVLREIGYSGMVMNLSSPKLLGDFDKYEAAFRNTPFKFYAGYYVLSVKDDNAATYAYLNQVLPRLQRVGGSLWLITQKTPADRAHVLEAIRTIADQAKASHVELVLYPHDNNLIESAEAALSYIQELHHDNIFVSLHLCHEIRAGNADRLVEVAQKIKPYLRLATINGADREFVEGTKDWSQTIQPLGKGNYDSANLLRALAAVNYSGPVILHTFGLQKAPVDHHQESFKRYQEMLKALQSESAGH